MLQFCRFYIPVVITEFWQLREQMLKIIIRSQIIEFCSFGYTVDHSTCLCTLDRVMEHPVFLPIQKVRIALSLAELSMEILPSVRKTLRYFSWFTLYRRLSAVLLLGGTAFSSSCFLTHAKYSSTSGLIVFFRSLSLLSALRSFNVPSSSYINDIRLNAWYAMDCFTAFGSDLSAAFMESA